MRRKQGDAQGKGKSVLGCGTFSVLTFFIMTCRMQLGRQSTICSTPMFFLPLLELVCLRALLGLPRPRDGAQYTHRARTEGPLLARGPLIFWGSSGCVPWGMLPRERLIDVRSSHLTGPASPVQLASDAAMTGALCLRMLHKNFL